MSTINPAAQSPAMKAHKFCKDNIGYDNIAATITSIAVGLLFAAWQAFALTAVLYGTYKIIEKVVIFIQERNKTTSKVKKVVQDQVKLIALPSKANLKKYLIQVYKQTKAAIRQGFYMDEANRKVDISDTYSKDHTWVVRTMGDLNRASQDLLCRPMPSLRLKETIEIQPNATIDAALDLRRRGYGRVGVLNFASFNKAGGGVERGASTQEEEMFRKTDLRRSLSYDNRKVKGAYVNEGGRFPRSGGIISPEVRVIRSNRESGYRWLSQPQKVTVFTSAAIDKKRGFPYRRDENYESVMEEKIEMVFKMANATNQSAIVVGAFGCGAYGGSTRAEKNRTAHQVATIFKKISEKYQNRFKIVYAITPGDNLNIFRQVLTQ